MKTNQTPETEIKNILESYYFKGIYEGNTELLKKVFHKDALLFGDIKDVPYYKTATEYIEGVGKRISPEKSGKEFKAKNSLCGRNQFNCHSKTKCKDV